MTVQFLQDTVKVEKVEKKKFKGSLIEETEHQRSRQDISSSTHFGHVTSVVCKDDTVCRQIVR